MQRAVRLGLAFSFAAVAAWAGPATHFTISAPATVVVGTPFNVNVTARDAAGAVDTAYAGTVTFSSSSPGMLPPNYTFVPGDNGIRAFQVTLTSKGTHTITVTDVAQPSITGSTAVNVNGIATQTTLAQSAYSPYVGDHAGYVELRAQSFDVAPGRHVHSHSPDGSDR